MSDAADLIIDVVEVLEDFGELCSFARHIEGAYSTDTLTTGSGTDTTFSGYGVPDFYKAYEIDGTVIQKTDSILYVRTSTAPLVGDVVTFNSVAYRVINVESTRFQGQTVLYKLQVRV
jgi:hypothetical protein